MKLKKACYWADFHRLFTGLKKLFARAITCVISSISPPLHFQTFSLVKLAALCYCGPTEHVPILLRAIALRDSTCSESTLLNALRQDYIFLFVCLFVILSWFLLCCWVATAFKNNQSLYSFRKIGLVLWIKRNACIRVKIYNSDVCLFVYLHVFFKKTAGLTKTNGNFKSEFSMNW